MPAAVAGVGTLRRTLTVPGAAQGISLSTHQGVDERDKQLKQHVGMGGGESFSQHSGQVDMWAVVIASIPLLE